MNSLVWLGGGGIRERAFAMVGKEQLMAAIAALAAVLVYANTLSNGFAYDDVWVIQTRAEVQDVANLPALLTADYWPEGRGGSGYYRPLTLTSFALDWSLWGGSPLGFHLTNVLVHAAVTALVTLLLLRFFPCWAGLAGGLVFAVHPVHTEAVANIVGRSELLGALLMIAACLIYAGNASPRKVSWRRVVAVTICYFFALTAKEGAIVLPALLLLIDLPAAVAGKLSGAHAYIRSRLPLVVGLVAALLINVGLRLALFGSPLQGTAGRIFVEDSSFGTRLFTMARVWPRIFELLFFPLELSADYSPAVILPAEGLTPLGAVGFLLVLATLALALAAYRRAPEATVAVGWAAVTLLPVSNLLLVAEFSLAERTLYLPSLAVSLLVGLALAGSPASRRLWGWAAVAVWLTTFSVVTISRNPVWASTESVFADLQRRHPESSRLLWYLGERQAALGNWAEAKVWYRRSLRVWPFAPYMAVFAEELTTRGELAEAEAIAARAAELSPQKVDYHALLAQIRLRRGDAHGAIAAAAAGLRLEENPVLHALQAQAYRMMGEHALAARAQSSLIRSRSGPTPWQDWFVLARLRAAAGDTLGAIEALDSLRTGAGPRALADSLERAWTETRSVSVP